MKRLNLTLVKNGSKASDILDFIRFLAAIVVFLFHFYVPLPGYQAVMVFFVLSGYFISSTILKSVINNKWSWSDYLLKRVTRLWIVLLPCLILTLIWGKIQLNLFGYHKLVESLNWETFLGNLFFVQEILVKPYGMNGPLWSLSYEFWYYILFPCLVLTIFSTKKKMKVLYAVLFTIISLFVGERIMLFFLVWLLGAIIPLIKPLNVRRSSLKFTMLLIAAIGVLLTTTTEKTWDSFLLDARIGLTFAIFMYLVISFFNNTKSSSKFNISKHLSGFSYTLYLTHYPLATFVMTWLVSPLWPFEQTTIVIKMSLASVIILYAWIIALLTEKHTDKVRIFIQKHIIKVDFKKEKKHPLVG